MSSVVKQKKTNVVKIPPFPALTGDANFALPDHWLKELGVEPWGMLRVLEDGSLEISIKTAEEPEKLDDEEELDKLVDPSEKILFQVGGKKPKRGRHLRSSWNDEQSIFGIVVPPARRGSSVRLSLA